MQKAYDKQLVYRSKLKSEQSEQSEKGIRHRRKLKAERKTIRLVTNWSESQIVELLKALEDHGTDWRAVAKQFENRSWRSVRMQVRSMIKKAKEDSSLPGADTLLNLTGKDSSWSKEEKVKFNEAILLHGKDWIKVSEHVETRRIPAIRLYARLFRRELEQDAKSKH